MKASQVSCNVTSSIGLKIKKLDCQMTAKPKTFLVLPWFSPFERKKREYFFWARQLEISFQIFNREIVFGQPEREKLISSMTEFLFNREREGKKKYSWCSFSAATKTNPHLTFQSWRANPLYLRYLLKLLESHSSLKNFRWGQFCSRF